MAAPHAERSRLVVLSAVAAVLDVRTFFAVLASIFLHRLIEPLGLPMIRIHEADDRTTYSTVDRPPRCISPGSQIMPR